MAYVILNIGSNLGDRRLNLSRAVRAIAAEFGMFEVSHTFESPSWGYDSPNQFLNICMMVQSDLQPHQILEHTRAIEHNLAPASHRDADGNYTDRMLDIDIVAIDDMVIDTPDLKLPHPHLAERRFFLVPMDEIAGGWRHPVTGLTPAEMIAKLPDDDAD